MNATRDFGRGPVPAHRHSNPDGSPGGWVADSATVHPTAWIHETATVAAGCILGAGCVLGERCRLGEGCRLGEWCSLGERCSLGVGCSLGDRCRLGEGCRLGEWCSLGMECILGVGCRLDAWCRLGAGCVLGERCNLGARCRLGGAEFLHTPPQTIIGQWVCSLYSPTQVAIGCKVHTFTEWRRRGFIQSLAEANGAAATDIEHARAFIALCRRMAPLVVREVQK